MTTIKIHGGHERRQVDRLVPYARNTRKHPEEQIALLVKAFIEWGFTIPVLVDEADGIIAGHARVLAAQRLGMPEVPVIVASGWSEAQRRAYVIADNKLPELAGWDMGLLGTEVVDLQLESFDLSITGFSSKELAALLDLDDLAAAPAPAAKTRKAAAAPTATIARPGDVWTIGAHRLMCGDSEPELVDAIVQRWQKSSKQLATLSTGQTWDEAVAERGVRQAGQGGAGDAIGGGAGAGVQGGAIEALAGLPGVDLAAELERAK
jgi:hypothetical protein